jgi:hypothetical protein
MSSLTSTKNSTIKLKPIEEFFPSINIDTLAYLTPKHEPLSLERLISRPITYNKDDYYTTNKATFYNLNSKISTYRKSISIAKKITPSSKVIKPRKYKNILSKYTTLKKKN